MSRYFVRQFKKKKTLQERQQESAKLRQAHPDRVPLIVDSCSGRDPELENKKYLVPVTLTFGQLFYTLRKRMKPLQAEQAVFFYTDNNAVVPQNLLLSQIYQEHVDEDGFLYLFYTLESTFGQRSESIKEIV